MNFSPQTFLFLYKEKEWRRRKNKEKEGKIKSYKNAQSKPENAKKKGEGLCGETEHMQ